MYYTGPDLFETRGGQKRSWISRRLLLPVASPTGKPGRPQVAWYLVPCHYTMGHAKWPDMDPKKIELEAPVGFCFTVSTVKHMGFEPPPWAITLILKFLLH